MNEGPTLLALASRQVWPHILAIAHLRPSRLILLHSDDDESKKPAQHLKKLFEQRSTLMAKGSTQLEPIPHDDFAGIGRRLAAVTEALAPGAEVLVNFTGGNKLMATASFRWAEAEGRRSFYLERGNRLIWFEPPAEAGGAMETKMERIDGGLTDNLDPLALIRCQTLESEIEREGERLALTESGKGVSREQFMRRIENGADPLAEGWIDKQGRADRDAKEGDGLEYRTAAVLLKHGVPEVRRSVRLKILARTGESLPRPHAEIDLLFNWSGKLWLVDCKDRVSEGQLIGSLRQTLRREPSPNTSQLLDRIEQELERSATKVLKEDVVAINEIGGLRGQIVCVRRARLNRQAAAYAKRNSIEVVYKKELGEGIRRLLFADRPASSESLAKLSALGNFQERGIQERSHR